MVQYNENDHDDFLQGSMMNQIEFYSSNIENKIKANTELWRSHLNRI